MAAISSISNGEALSSVRTKLNDVITEINLLDPTGWVDYSATSTIVGWSSFTTKIIRYRVIGKQVFVEYNLDGTSNSTSTTFTLPFNCINVISFTNNIIVDNGVSIIGSAQLFINSNNLILYKWTSISAITNTFTASGSKLAKGQFFYEIA